MSDQASSIPEVSPETVEPGIKARRHPSQAARQAMHAAFQEDRFFLMLAVFIGVFSGLAVVCFRLAIDWIHIVLLGPVVQPHARLLLLVPALVSLVVAVLLIHVFPGAPGSGVNQTKAALYIYNGFIPFRTAIGKFVTAALAIGAGHSLGPEDPSLQIGAGLASFLGRRLDLSRQNNRLLAPVGAAAGLAAAFNAPISAVLFVIEEVIGRWSVGILGAVVLAAISSVVVVRFFLGSEPLFGIPATMTATPVELLAYGVLGVVGGLAAVIFAKSIGYFRPRLRTLPRWTQYFQPAIAGFLVGLIAYLGVPQVMGAGYRYMDEAIHGQFTWRQLAMLAGVKIVATTLSFISGTPGGMFAPTLFVGAMLGAAVGHAGHLLFPHLIGSPATYALVGMGVLFAGFLRAPMTSVFMVLEITGNYSIILPVIVANAAAYAISRILQPTPIFDLLTRQDGLILPSLEEEREQTILRVEDAMRPVPAPVLQFDDSVAQALSRIKNSSEAIFLVRTFPTGWAVATREFLTQAAGQGKNELTLGSLLSKDRSPSLYPDLPLDVAMRYVNRAPLVPVVNRADPRRLEGIITRESVLKCYTADSNAME
jgi:chloride channel protein, CIC family